MAKETEARLDKFGRVVIPKPVRDHLGLEPGAVFKIEGREDGIVLRPVQAEPDLVMKDGVLVFTGEAEGDLEETVRKQRQERIAHLAAWPRE